MKKRLFRKPELVSLIQRTLWGREHIVQLGPMLSYTGARFIQEYVPWRFPDVSLPRSMMNIINKRKR